MAHQLDDPDASLKQIISNLYHLMVQAHDYNGAATQQAMINETKQFVQALGDLEQAGKGVAIKIPIDLIGFVEQARNPDIYTRQFVEEAMRLNQELKGKTEALSDFRDILAREMMGGIPDIKEEIRQIVIATGGKVD